MIKRSAAALLLSSALMTGVALAQTSTAPAPATSSPAAGATMGSAAAGSTQFLTQQDQGQFRASKFVGLAIYGQDNQRIGDVNEILIDGSGNAKAVVIGVGGFLGIGEKNVAVPFAAVEWVNERPASTAATTGTTGTAGSGASTTAMGTNPPAGGSASAGMGTAGTASRDASVTGSTAAAPARSGAETAAANGYPDHGKVRMSKADLQNAPAFKWYGETQSNADRGTGTAPRQ